MRLFAVRGSARHSLCASLAALAMLLAVTSARAAGPPLSKTDPLANERAGVRFILRGQYGEALRQLSGAPSSGTGAASTENLRGLAMMLDDHVREALPHFERAITLDPALIEPHFNRAIAWLKLERFADAAKELDAIYRNPANAVTIRADAAYHLGIATQALGSSNVAEQWFMHARELDPRLDGALLYLGALRESRGDFSGAGEAYRDFLQRHPESVVAMLRFAVVAQRAGHVDVAQKYFRQVIDGSPDSVEAAEARKYLVMWE
jgi:tetratricopeptide (TPR) repeat protein